MCDAARAHGIELGEGGTAALSAISATSSAAIRAHELVSASAAPAEADAASEAASRTAAATGDGAPLSAFALKAHADRAFAAGALEDAVALYGDALRADATAEWERLTDLPLSPPRAADATTCDDAGFVPADGYAGSMPGFVFTTRAGRLGYHRDARARAGVDGAVGSPAAEANARTRAQGEAGSEAEAVTVSGAPADDELHAIIRAAEQPKSGVHLRCLCLSNRAACHLKLGDYARAVDDCTAALAAVRTLTVGDEGMPVRRRSAREAGVRRERRAPRPHAAHFKKRSRAAAHAARPAPSLPAARSAAADGRGAKRKARRLAPQAAAAARSRVRRARAHGGCARRVRGGPRHRAGQWRREGRAATAARARVRLPAEPDDQRAKGKRQGRAARGARKGAAAQAVELTQCR